MASIAPSKNAAASSAPLDHAAMAWKEQQPEAMQPRYDSPRAARRLSARSLAATMTARPRASATAATAASANGMGALPATGLSEISFTSAISRPGNADATPSSPNAVSPRAQHGARRGRVDRGPRAWLRRARWSAARTERRRSNRRRGKPLVETFGVLGGIAGRRGKDIKGQHAAAALEAAASVAAGSVGIGTLCGEDGHADRLERDRDEVRDGLEELVALARIDGCGLSPSVEDEAHDVRRLCDSLGDLYTR